MGKKYLLEIEENKDGGFAWSNFAPYTAPDLEQIKKEAYEKGQKDLRESCVPQDEEAYGFGYHEGFQQGLGLAWEAARKIGSNSMCSLKEMGFDFGQCVVADYNPSWFVVKNYSASECIEKIRQYEQENQFHIGDEFETESGKRFVILKMDDKEVDRYIDGDGTTYCMISKYQVMRKTGRHFPEIAAVLEKMKE